MATEQQSRPTGISAERAEQLLKEFVAIRSVVGDKTTAHLWMTERMREIGMTVEHYPVEGRTAPFVLGVIEGEGDGPGVLFDAHFDTVHAVPDRLVPRPLERRTSRTASSTAAARSTRRARWWRC